MNWRELTEADLLASLNAVEREGYTNATVSKGDDPASSILVNITYEARGFIAGNADNGDMPEGTLIPNEVVAHALAIARHRLLAWADVKVSEDRVREFESAERFLKSVAKGEVRITPHTQPSPEASAQVVKPLWSKRKPRTLNGH